MALPLEMDPRNMILLLFLSNGGLMCRGFTIRSCYLVEDKVSCSKQNLKEVPTDIPPTVKRLDLSKNNIAMIQVLNFIHFPNLTTLDLKKNSISSIGKRTFSHLPSLNQLILNRNRIVQLEDDVFDGLSKLTQLLLAFNRIRTVAPNTFRSLGNLRLLELSRNQLRTIEQVHLAIRHMPNLKNLQLRNNGIVTFKSSDLTNTSINITYLGLSENPLQKFEVTADVFAELATLNIGKPYKNLNLMWSVQNRSALSHVTTLDISAIRLASYDEWTKLFSTFKSLTFIKLNSMKYRPSVLVNMSCSNPTVSKLQLQTNKFKYISSTFFQLCDDVTEIDLDSNHIQRVDNDSFSSLRRLQVLSIKSNKLMRVPFATRNVQSLQEFDLSFNGIRSVECDDFARLTNLIQLNLQWNNITSLSKCMFANLIKLEVLKLQGNYINKLGSAFQKNLPNLKILYLNHNKLTSIAKHEFRGLSSLVNLSLAENQIHSLEKSAFHGLKSLMFLQLQMNDLKSETLKNNCFKDLINLKRLDLGNNHFKFWSSAPLETPPFLNLSRLETLIFSVQRARGLGYIHSNFLQGLTNLSSFISNNIQVLSFPDSFFTHTPRITYLDISANGLLDVSPHLFSPMAHLKLLRISSTNLQSLDFLMSANLAELQFLEARKNAFSVISKDIIRSVPSLSVLDLQFNSFMCDCDNSWFVKWIVGDNQTEVVNAHGFKCSYPPQSKNKTLLDLKVQSCLLDVGFICFVTTACANVLLVVPTFIYHFSRFHLTYAYYIFLAWIFDSKNKQKRNESRYDAFVSYNTHDEPWVYEELVPRLEQEQGWKLCLHHRDFLPGKPIVENIAEAIYESRKTICVISRRYLQSEWCSKELQLASFRLFDEREDVLILVFLENIPSSHLSPYYRMKKVLKKRTYLSWPGASDQQLFWEKLRRALRSTNTAADDRLLLTVTQ